MDRWHKRILDLAFTVASWSKDPSTKVGAVIVDDKFRILSVGYNGFPRGVEDTEERLNDRPTKYSLVVHAELNAILNATASIGGASLYVTHFPCNECAKAIIQSGIKNIYCHEDAFLDRWGDSQDTSSRMFRETNTRVHTVINDG